MFKKKQTNKYVDIKNKYIGLGFTYKGILVLPRYVFFIFCMLVLCIIFLNYTYRLIHYKNQPISFFYFFLFNLKTLYDTFYTVIYFIYTIIFVVAIIAQKHSYIIFFDENYHVKQLNTNSELLKYIYALFISHTFELVILIIWLIYTKLVYMSFAKMHKIIDASEIKYTEFYSKEYDQYYKEYISTLTKDISNLEYDKKKIIEKQRLLNNKKH